MTVKKREILHLRDSMEKQQVDAVLVSSRSNVFYLSGFYGLSSQEREAYCFITKKNIFFITSPLYEHDIKPNGLIVRIVSQTNRLIKILEEIVNSENIKTVGFEQDNVSVAEFNEIKKIKSEFKPFSFKDIRKIKSVGEIEKIKKACSVGDKVYNYILGQIKINMTEAHLASVMEIAMRNHDCLPSFPTIVAFGKNAAVPHHIPGKESLKKNQFVLLDFGVIFGGYCSDMTRTIFFGNPGNEDKNMHNTVKIAQEKAVGYIKNKLASNGKSRINSNQSNKSEIINIQSSEVDKSARDYIVSQGYPDFPHSLGHGIGIDVHESPSLAPSSKDILAEGMVFSIEPGIYLPENAGVRIEDLFAIQGNSLTKLTGSPVDLQVR